MHGNRVASPTTAKTLAQFHDGVPAILLNDYKNGQVLTINWKAFHMYLRVTSDVLTNAVDTFGSTQIYVVKEDVNSGKYAPFTATTNWLEHYGYSSSQTTLNGISKLPASSLLVIPGVYSYSESVIASIDNHLSNGGNVIFIDGPTTTIKGNSQTFKDILGVTSTAKYLQSQSLIVVPDPIKDHPLIADFVGTHSVSYDDAQQYIDMWYEYMQGTLTEVVSGVKELASVVRPEAYISAANFPAEYGNNLKVHQDWPKWLDSGYLDYNMTMGYTLDFNEFVNRIDWLASRGYQDITLPGLGVHEFTTCKDIEVILAQMDYIRSKGFHGFTIFDSKYLTDTGQVAHNCGVLEQLQSYFGEDVEPYYPSIDTTPSGFAVGRASRPAYIDGYSFEYENASEIFFKDDSGRGLRDNEVSAKMMWDFFYLYLFVEVADTQLNADLAQGSLDEGVWRDDVVEVFIDKDNNGGIEYSEGDYRFAINVNGALMDGKDLFDDHSWKFSNLHYEVIANGTINNNSDTDTGYVIEVAIPWNDLDLEVNTDKMMRIDIGIGDKDLETDGYQYFDWAHLTDFNYPNLWSKVKLDSQFVGTDFSDYSRSLLKQWGNSFDKFNYEDDALINMFDYAYVVRWGQL